MLHCISTVHTFFAKGNDMPRKIADSGLDIEPAAERQEAIAYDVYADIGHGYGKFLCGNRQASFATVIASVQPDEADFTSTGKRKRFVIQLGEQYYAVDQDALENRRNLRRRLDQSALGGELHRVVMVAGFT